MNYDLMRYGWKIKDKIVSNEHEYQLISSFLIGEEFVSMFNTVYSSLS